MKLNAPLILSLLVVGIWPQLLHANTPEQVPSPATSGFLLIASQQMSDPRVRETVIVVGKHGDSGHIGVVVNRPQDVTLDEVFPDFPTAGKFKLFAGGPVYPQQLFYLARGADAVKGALLLSENIYLAFDPLELGELLSGKKRYKDLRVVNGMASWAPGQLEHEIKVGGWHVMPIDDVAIFDRPPTGMWKELILRATSIKI